MTHTDKSINYVEFPLTNSQATQQLYKTVFGWEFKQWGPNYLSFSGAGVDGGFNGEDKTPVQAPGVLIVLYAADLQKAHAAVSAAGAKIVRNTYAFPGGMRFHFTDPNGNELAVWSEAVE